MALPPRWQDEARLLMPPDAEVEHAIEAAGAVGELALVNDEARVVVACKDLGDDPGRRVRLPVSTLGLKILSARRPVVNSPGTADLDFAEVFGGERLLLETTMGP